MLTSVVETFYVFMKHLDLTQWLTVTDTVLLILSFVCP